MRMWMVNPETMCRKHLLGEHVEIHMLAGSILKGKSIKGFSELVETHSAHIRHYYLAEEMVRRGYNHKSPLPDFSMNFGKVNVAKSIMDLHERCPDCKSMWWSWFNSLVFEDRVEIDRYMMSKYFQLKEEKNAKHISGF